MRGRACASGSASAQPSPQSPHPNQRYPSPWAPPGALPCLCERLEDADAQTKAAATWVLGAIAAHDAALAASVADAGALTPLMLCLKEPSLPLRRVALSCFGSVGLALTLTLTLTLALTLALALTLTLTLTSTILPRMPSRTAARATAS